MKSFDIETYGARPDGTTLNTRAIQTAIDECHEDGGGVVSCGPGRFLTGSIELKCGVELHLGHGCSLVASTDIRHYDDFEAPGFHGAKAPERSTKSLVRAIGANDVAITGPGEINGSGLAFYDTGNRSGRFFRKPDNERPRMVMMYECTDIRIEGASFVDSPCWTFWLMKCERIGIRGARVRGDQRMINNDGIDIDSCRDVTISDCLLKTGDDCLILRAIDNMFEKPEPCERVTVTNCVLDSWCQGIRLGCPGDGTIRNATFSNIVIESANNGILIEHPKRYLPEGDTGSADMHDLRFSGFVINCAGAPIRANVEEGIALKRLSDISFSDMRIVSGQPCRIEGSSQTTIRDVSLSDIDIDCSGEDAVVFRRCRGVVLDRVRLAHNPDREDD